MAKIYSKTASDKCLILEPRQALLYPFNAGAWTDLRVALAISLTGSADDNSVAPTESVTIVGTNTWAGVGLKNSSNQALPGDSTSRFVGLVSPASTVTLLTGAISLHCSCWNGASLSRKVSAESMLLPINTNAVNATQYSNVWRFRFQVQDRGTGSQQISVSAAGMNPRDYTVTATGLLAMLDEYTGTDSYFSLTGDVPDAFFCRFPFFNSRVRLHALAIQRFA